MHIQDISTSLYHFWIRLDSLDYENAIPESLVFRGLVPGSEDRQLQTLYPSRHWRYYTRFMTVTLRRRKQKGEYRVSR